MSAYGPVATDEKGMWIGEAQWGLSTAHGCGGCASGSCKGPAEVLRVEVEVWPILLVDSNQGPWRASVLLIYTKPLCVLAIVLPRSLLEDQFKCEGCAFVH